jgi:Zn-dependent protease
MNVRDRWSWNLGTIAGIPTRIHASFALLLAWVGVSAWGNTGSMLGVLVGLTFIAAVFGSVLAHEFGHALMAREHGVRTESVTLYPIGGIARLQDTAPSARAELQIALAGPAVNAVLALTFGGLAFAAPAAGFVAGFAGALALANLGLGLFNMIPAFPMDGGRVLRAFLQPRVGRLRATEIAARLGKFGAVALGVAGLFGNPWLLVIAPVLWMIGQRELRAVRMTAAHAGIVEHLRHGARRRPVDPFGPFAAGAPRVIDRGEGRARRATSSEHAGGRWSGTPVRVVIHTVHNVQDWARSRDSGVAWRM